jgi:hypothetical protein
MNKKEQFKVALKMYSLYSVDEFLMFKITHNLSKCLLSLKSITYLLYVYGLSVTFEYFM